MSQSLNDFIKAKALGFATVKPDEKRAFLGNFRERVAMAVTVRQLHDPAMTELLASVLARYPQYRLYLNGRMPAALINLYMQQAIAADYPFTVLAQTGMRVTRPVTGDDFGWVLADPRHQIQRPILL